MAIARINGSEKLIVPERLLGNQWLAPGGGTLLLSCRGAGDRGFRGGVGSELAFARDLEDFGEPVARPVDPALDSPHGDIADRCGLLIGEARRGDQEERLALVGG